MKLIAPLFMIERESRVAGDNAAQRKARRQDESKPIVESRNWLFTYAVASLLPDRIAISHPELRIPGFEASELPD